MKAIFFVVLVLMALVSSTTGICDSDFVNANLDNAFSAGVSDLDELSKTSICGGSCGGIPFRWCAATSQGNNMRW